MNVTGDLPKITYSALAQAFSIPEVLVNKLLGIKTSPTKMCFHVSIKKTPLSRTIIFKPRLSQNPAKTCLNGWKTNAKSRRWHVASGKIISFLDLPINTSLPKTLECSVDSDSIQAQFVVSN